MAVGFDPFERARPGTKTRYVIVGCGYCAVLDHITLRQSDAGRKRLDGRPVLHIGYDDPWRHYRPHDMGQFPHLLELPGYHTRFRETADPTRPLPSNVFAEATEREFNALLDEPGNKRAPLGPRLEGWVALIQSRDHGERGLTNGLKALAALGIDVDGLDAYPQRLPPYRLVVVTGAEGGRVRPKLVYADRIDLCVGSGVPRMLEEGQFGDPDALSAYRLAPWERVESYAAPRFAVPAQHALYRNTVSPDGKDARLCIYGAGGVALNLVETRLGVPDPRPEDPWLDWMANEVHQRWNCDRNNAVFADVEAEGVLPRHPKLRLGEWVGIHSVENGRVTFRANDEGPSHPLCEALENDGVCKLRDFRDQRLYLNGSSGFSNGSPAEELPARYDQLLISMGLRAEVHIPGTAAFIIQDLKPVQAVVAQDGQMVALKTPGGAVRILGSAALTFDLRFAPSARNSKAKEASVDHYETLPVQARPSARVVVPKQEKWRVPIASITYNAASVAIANGLLGERRPNRNVNTTEEGTLGKLLGGDLLAESLAQTIVDIRMQSQTGFTNVDELADALDGGVARGEWRVRLQQLRYDYADVEGW